MKTKVILSTLLASTLAAVAAVAPAETQAQESDAKAILKAMSDYVGSQKTMQLAFDSDIEVITPQLEKIQFTNSGEALLSRPDKLHAHRVGGYSDVALFFDGKTVRYLRKACQRLRTVRCPGQRGPADRGPAGRAMASRCPVPTCSCPIHMIVLVAGVQEAKYIGHGVIDGVTCEHLAFRNFDTDWQLWVEVGERPIPRKLVITSKTLNSAPQYTLRVKEWKTGIEPSPDDFTFTPPANAKMLDPMRSSNSMSCRRMHRKEKIHETHHMQNLAHNCSWLLSVWLWNGDIRTDPESGLDATRKHSAADPPHRSAMPVWPDALPWGPGRRALALLPVSAPELPEWVSHPGTGAAP